MTESPLCVPNLFPPNPEGTYYYLLHKFVALICSLDVKETLMTLGRAASPPSNLIPTQLLLLRGGRGRAGCSRDSRRAPGASLGPSQAPPPHPRCTWLKTKSHVTGSALRLSWRLPVGREPRRRRLLAAGPNRSPGTW